MRNSLIYRICALLLAWILLTATVITSYALSRQYITQQGNIRIISKSDNGELVIEKIVENLDGSPLTYEQEMTQFAFVVTFYGLGGKPNSRTYTYRIGEDGVEQTLTSGGTIWLRHGEQAFFENLPLGTPYTVEELPVHSYTSHGHNHQGIIENSVIADHLTNLASICDQCLAQIIITNTVENADGSPVFYIPHEQEFEFLVTLDMPEGTVIDVFTGLQGLIQRAVENGQFTLTLHHGETAVILDLMPGMAYVVQEIPTPDYIPSVWEYTGQTFLGSVILPFVNVYESVPPVIPEPPVTPVPPIAPIPPELIIEPPIASVPPELIIVPPIAPIPPELIIPPIAPVPPELIIEPPVAPIPPELIEPPVTPVLPIAPVPPESIEPPEHEDIESHEHIEIHETSESPPVVSAVSALTTLRAPSALATLSKLPALSAFIALPALNALPVPLSSSPQPKEPPPTEDVVVVARFVNIYHHCPAQIIIGKTVKNADGSPITYAQYEQEFTFVVSIDLPDGTVLDVLTGSQTITQQTVMDGKLTLTLRHGEIAVVLDLPSGITYTVQEMKSSDYAPTPWEYTGQTVPGSVIAPFVNTYGGEPTTPPDPPVTPEIPTAPVPPDPPVTPEIPIAPIPPGYIEPPIPPEPPVPPTPPIFPEPPIPPEVTEPTDPPEVPEIVEPTEPPETPELTEPDELPEIPELVEPQEPPESSELSEQPSVPNVPNVPSTPSTPRAPASSGKVVAPQTGDEANPSLWIMLIMASLVGLMGMGIIYIIYRRRRYIPKYLKRQ